MEPGDATKLLFSYSAPVGQNAYAQYVATERADGVHHVRRYGLKELHDDLQKCGFDVEWTDFVPAYTMPDAILDDIRKNPSWARKAVQCVNLMLSLLPWEFRYRLARLAPDRFGLIFIVKAVRK